MVAVRGAGWAGYLTVGLALVAVVAVAWAFLFFSGGIARVLGETGVTLASRLAGLLLAAIAVQMAADGVWGLAAPA
jgi:multiple antibiotic resistance protein